MYVKLKREAQPNLGLFGSLSKVFSKTILKNHLGVTFEN